VVVLMMVDCWQALRGSGSSIKGGSQYQFRFTPQRAQSIRKF